MFTALKRALRVRVVSAVAEATWPEFERLRGEVEQLRAQVASMDAGVRQELVRVEHRDRRNLFAAAEREAVQSSARYVQEHFAAVPSFTEPLETLRHALAAAPSDGLALEFGVYQGTTIREIRAHRAGPVVGFDSFEGLPEAWRPGYPAGFFGDIDVPEIEGVDLVVGWFESTLPAFLAEHSEPVAFAHIDCDLYSSTVTVLAHLAPRLRVGSIVLFDEYLNHPSWQQGEVRAWAEFVASTGITYEYLGYTIDHEQVAVRITGLGSLASR